MQEHHLLRRPHVLASESRDIMSSFTTLPEVFFKSRTHRSHTPSSGFNKSQKGTQLLFSLRPTSRASSTKPTVDTTKSDGPPPRPVSRQTELSTISTQRKPISTSSVARQGAAISSSPEPFSSFSSKQQYRQHQQLVNNNFFPTPHEKGTYSHQKAVEEMTKPDGAIMLEAQLEQELTLLASQNLSHQPMEQLRVYQEVTNGIIHTLPGYANVLSRVFKGYNDFCEMSKSKWMKCRALEREVHEIKDAHLNEIALLKIELDKSDEKMQEELRRIDAKVKATISVTDIIYNNEDLTRKLENSQKLVERLKEKLGATTSVRTEFQRAMRSIEDTYTVINDEKDLKLSSIVTEHVLAYREIMKEKERYKEEVQQMRYKMDSYEIRIDSLEKRQDLLVRRVKDGDHRIGCLLNDLDTATTELEGMAQRLMQYEASSSTLPKDPTLTPRPDKADMCARIKVMGDVTNYGTTTAFVIAMSEKLVAALKEVEHHQTVLAHLDELIEKKLQEKMKRTEQDMVGSPLIPSSPLGGVDSNSDVKDSSVEEEQ